MKSFYSNPYLYIFISYLLAISVGTFLLSLPVSSYEKTNFINALYTATSAICVTGLTVFDIGAHFTLFGQIVILFLIQIGGLGIIIVSSILLLIIRREFSFLNQYAVEESLTMDRKIKTKKLILYVISIALIVEIIGAGILYNFLSDYFDPGVALYQSIFLAISSFCNAGFTLFSNSLENFRSNLGVNFTIMALIFLGGVGYFVLIEFIRNFRKYKLNFKKYKFSIHSKIVFKTSISLIIVGALLFFFIEYSSLILNYSLKDTIVISLFQSVTARTAGFSSINIGTISSATLLLIIVLMFIGASPASCGGGIKTTTFVVLLKCFISNIKNRDFVFTHSRTIPREIVRKAISLFLVSLVWIFFATVTISYLENTSLVNSSFRTIDVFFEVVSAFGTVGLSTGITEELTSFSKFVIILTMYFGKTGFLTLVSLLAFSNKPDRYLYPEEDIFVG
jgi:trk system potassium uptake protein TrkH